jgi:hypothetical protein
MKSKRLICRRHENGIEPVLARRAWKLNKKPLLVAQHSRIERKDPGASVAGRAGIYIKFDLADWP